ncbi:xanthine dehydrogenase family protein subunit M [Chitinophaga horti]|uniref:Xanthine dehydrogenase family protein subunit M n=1 Tax=Chitinophaga horti TaxID=2920382 RepID=A0ABY6JC44_9BACT|nr:xanthine dehydrogenase family protein subunit M [Chitinophaga horti]UYQ95861.1 xanthine dehydrogenase family protein subunit M [Chitinophaga horti]
MKPFSFGKRDNASKALAAKKDGAQFLAGGTNLVDLMKKHIATPDELIDINATLSNKVEAVNGGIRIGAMVRNSVIANDPMVLSKSPLVAKAVLAGASPQIRNMASTGGNLLQRTRCPYFYDVSTPCNKRKPGSGCSALEGSQRMSAVIGYNEQCVAVHPSDLCVALVALDAKVNILTKGEQRSVIPFRQFHKLPGNSPQLDNTLPENALIMSIDVPDEGFNKNYAYVKLRDRESYAFALVSVAAALKLQGNRITEARLASGGVAHKPWRWEKAEQFLKGKEATPANFGAAADVALEDVKPLPGNLFKKVMLRGAIETALQNSLTA